MSRCHAILPESLRRLRGRAGLGSRFLQAERSPVPARSWRTFCGGSCGCWTRTPPPSCWSSRHGRMCWSWWATGASACNCGGLYEQGLFCCEHGASQQRLCSSSSRSAHTARLCKPPARPPAPHRPRCRCRWRTRSPPTECRTCTRGMPSALMPPSPSSSSLWRRPSRWTGAAAGGGVVAVAGSAVAGVGALLQLLAGRGDGGRAGGGSTAAQGIVRQHCCDACITRIRAVKELHAAGLFSVTSCPPVMLHALYSSSQTRMACSCLQRCRRAEQRRSATAAAAGTAAAGQAGRQRAQLD